MFQTVFGFLAIERGQLIFGRWSAHLLLDGQNDFTHLTGIDALEQTTKGRLCRSRILAPGGCAGCQGPGAVPGSSRGQTWLGPSARVEHRRA
jgi:hypothetical protein